MTLSRELQQEKSQQQEDLTVDNNQLSKALAKAEERINLILAATSEAIYEWDLLTDEILWSESFLTMMGYERAMIKPTLQFWVSLLHPQDRQKVETSLDDAIRKGAKYWEQEYQLRQADGSYVFILERGYFLHNDQGTPIRMVGALKDITAQKQTEQALESLSEEHAFVLHQIPVLVFRALPDGKVDFVNQQCQEYTGLSAEEILDTGWLKALHPSDVNTVYQAWQQAINGGEVYQSQHRLRKHDGTYRWFQFHAVPYTAKSGKIIKWFGTCTDIHDQKQAQEASQKNLTAFQQAKAEAEAQREYLYTLLMSIPAPISILSGPDYILEFANPLLQELLGDRLKPGQPFRNSLEGLPIDWFMSMVEAVYQTGTPVTVQEMPIYANTVTFSEEPSAYLNLLFQAIKNGQDQTTGVLIFANDVSEQVKARRKVEESKSQIQSILEGIPAIAWTLQVNGASIYYNKRWYTYCGLNPNQAFNVLEFIHSDDLPMVGSSWEKAQNDKQGWEAQYRLRRSDGMYRWHLGRTVPVQDQHGTLIEWFGVATDIHDQKQAQHKLEETLKELNEKNFELDQFVYKTSHDLRAPLTTILGLVTIIKAEPEEVVRMQYVDLIENRVQKLDNFIKSMLAYSRNTRTQITLTKIDWQGLLEECLAELSSVKHFERLKVSWHITGEAFYSDLFRLKIMFSNLISNAIKYQDFAKQESYLIITIQVAQQGAIIDFQDNGVGINQPYQEKIFDMFFRATEQSEGSGLGLYIVKQAASVLQGKITFESQSGIGTHFKISLPSTLDPPHKLT